MIKFASAFMLPQGWRGHWLLSCGTKLRLLCMHLRIAYVQLTNLARTLESTGSRVKNSMRFLSLLGSERSAKAYASI